jgi:hypothetical protein
MAHVCLMGTESWSEYSAPVLQMAMLDMLLLSEGKLASSWTVSDSGQPDSLKAARMSRCGGGTSSKPGVAASTGGVQGPVRLRLPRAAAPDVSQPLIEGECSLFRAGLLGASGSVRE